MATPLNCPITHEPIVIAGITAIGSIYDYTAITEWLQDHSTDPLTNLTLPTKIITRVENASHIDIALKAKDIRLSTTAWCHGFKMIHDSPIIYGKLEPLKENVKSQEWQEYSKMKALRLPEQENDSMYFKLVNRTDDVDSSDLIPRPPNTGRRFQFVTIQNIFISGKSFKSDLFDFAILKDCIFRECDFSRCRFIGATFDNVKFINCRFIGEEISFYRATIPGELIFMLCTFEHLSTWISTTDPDEIRRILSDRMLTGTKYTVK